MVNAGAAVAQRGGIDIQVARQFFRRSLYRMAQADLFDMRITGIHRPGIHRHRVDVIEHGGLRTDFRHVFANPPQMRDGPQRAHDAARPQRIGDRLFQAMTLTNLKIGHGAGFIAANLKGDHHEIRIL